MGQGPSGPGPCRAALTPETRDFFPPPYFLYENVYEDLWRSSCEDRSCHGELSFDPEWIGAQSLA